MRVACLILGDVVFAHCQRSLSDYGLTAVRYTCELRLLRALRTESIDAVLVDVGADSALESRVFACLQRDAVGRVPFVLQTPGGLARSNALALEAGFADVVVRGMEAVELAARLIAVVRRGCHDENAATQSIAGFVLDRVNRSVTDRDAPVDLTPREFALAWLLFSHAGQCVSRRVISRAVWGVESDVSCRTMEQHIHQIRKKLGFGPERGVSISAVYGAGYLLAAHGPASPVARADKASVPERSSWSRRQSEAAPARQLAGLPWDGNVPAVQVARIDWMLAGPPSFVEIDRISLSDIGLASTEA